MKEEQITEVLARFREDLIAVYMSHENGNDLVARAIALLRMHLKDVAVH